uniref:rho guanine nucleotide exchange factor 7-like isoform X2 n=1 Tax=Myxine glutinosa TaxID=7769 RepID=UPI0035900693
MAEGGGQRMVRARFTFQRTNEDELSFTKGDIITVHRAEEGGWWEGTLNGRTGWFPYNYIKEIKQSDKPTSPKGTTARAGHRASDAPSNKGYYGEVVQNIVETERTFLRSLQASLCTHLRPLQATDKLPDAQQRVGGCYLGMLPHMRSLYKAYCSNHPWAVKAMQDHKDFLGEFVESQGAPTPGIQELTSTLSRPFVRLDKYTSLFRELERHMDESHNDHADIQQCLTAFKTLATECSEVRRRRELELHVLSEPIRNWEGADMSSFGAVLYMSAASVQCAGNDECNDRYLVLFPNVLLLLSASPCMSGFIYQGKLPLTGLTVNKLEDMGAVRNAFEISGSMIERIVVCCRSFPQREEWTDHLQKQARGCVVVKPTGAPSLPSSPPASKLHESNVLPMNPGYHTLPVAGAYGGLRAAAAQTGGLAPAKVSQPWGLSSLRPAPPVRPSAALIYKEELSKSPKTVKKLLRKARKPSDEDWLLRKSTAAALEEDTQILKVIEAYCTSAKTRQTLNSMCPPPHVILPEEEKVIMESHQNDGKTLIEEKSLVDAVYSLKDTVQELKQETQALRLGLDEESRARRELENLIRRFFKTDIPWNETNI